MVSEQFVPCVNVVSMRLAELRKIVPRFHKVSYEIGIFYIMVVSIELGVSCRDFPESGHDFPQFRRRPFMLWRFSAVLLFVTIMLWGTIFRSFRNFFSFHFFPFCNKNKTIDNDCLLRLNKTSLRNKIRRYTSRVRDRADDLRSPPSWRDPPIFMHFKLF